MIYRNWYRRWVEGMITIGELMSKINGEMLDKAQLINIINIDGVKSIYMGKCASCLISEEAAEYFGEYMPKLETYHLHYEDDMVTVYCEDKLGR